MKRPVRFPIWFSSIVWLALGGTPSPGFPAAAAPA